MLPYQKEIWYNPFFLAFFRYFCLSFFTITLYICITLIISYQAPELKKFIYQKDTNKIKKHSNKMLLPNREFSKDLKIVNIEELEYTNIFYDPDRKKTQNIFSQNNKNSAIPIVIDYGSYATKAGWTNYENPNMVFRTIVSKNKDAKANEAIIVGNKLKDFDFKKANYKSPFEKNVIQHIGLLENVNDYIFSELGVDDTRVNHPIVMTECFANPEFFRTRIIEQMFECYQVPSLILGVDCLFSYHYNMLNKQDKSDCLIISLGNSTTHIAPIIKGELQIADVKRINVGGSHSFELLYRHMNLKYPGLKSKLTQNYIQALMENLTFVANNYTDQLNYFKHGSEYFKNKNYINKIQFENNQIINQNIGDYLQDPILVQFPSQHEEVKLSSEDLKRKQELRKEQAQRLKETMAKRKEEKLENQKKELIDLENADAEIDKDASKQDQILQFWDFQTRDDIKKRIVKLKLKLGLVTKQTLDEEKYNLLSIPNDQLTPDQLKQKRYQIMQRQAAITRKLKKELESKNKEEMVKLKEENPEIYLADLYEKRKMLIDKIQERKKLRNELLGNTNRRLSQKRMQTLAQLGSDLPKDKKGNIVDNFGVNDEDWNVYKKLQKDAPSDEENYEARLNDIEKELQKLDKNYEINTKITLEQPFDLFNSQENVIEMNVDRIRGPEVFFQPSLSGVDQAGLAEVINLVVNKYIPSVKESILQNIYLTGGAAFINNIEKRLVLELQALNPVGTKIVVKRAKDPIFDTWKGMQTFAKKKDNITKYAMTKAEYDEYGPSFTKVNPFSNIFNVMK